jgi:DNA-binding MarR family transcriptional regulator
MVNDHREPVKSSLDAKDLARLADRAGRFAEAAAERLGLNLTDVRCLVIAATEPDMTPGRLAELSDLTTGAITGVLDRLERAGLARREPDPTDRRRTLVRLLGDRQSEIDAVNGPLEAALAEVIEACDVATRRAVAGVIAEATRVYEQQAARLRVGTRGGMVGDMFRAPIGDATEGRFTFASGAPRLSLRAAPLGPGSEARVVAELARSELHIGGPTEPGELCRATMSGPLPDVVARRGELIMRYQRRLDLRHREARVALTPELPWAIAVGGGLSLLSADLVGIRLRELAVQGGISEINLRLGEADGSSRIRIEGMSEIVTISAPRRAAVRVILHGGASEVAFDRDRMRDVHGTVRLATPGVGAAGDRFEIELRGGVRSLAVVFGDTPG